MPAYSVILSSSLVRTTPLRKRKHRSQELIQQKLAEQEEDPMIFFDPADKAEEQKVRDAHAELARRLYETGAVPFKLAPYWVDNVTGIERYIEFVASVKRLLDPQGIMNPGVMAGI